MKTNLLVVIVYICSLQFICSQESDGVVAFALPIRNSLTFNRQIINPTFSFVREQHKFVSFFNKREWTQFDDAPNTYIGSYSGRFSENIGAGVSVFQQNYGVLTTFGGVLNFAYNIRLARESNLTFGLNLGAYSSGVNTSNVITNFEDPSLLNVPSNFLVTVNPGINYGNEFIDFGVSVNNLVLYNIESSSMVEDTSARGIQAHVMYTGFMESKGFFDKAKFSGLVRSEFKEDNTIISGLAMLTIPTGVWAQAGYNSVYGISGGLGLNITEAVAIEYNFEKGIGDLTDFGPSHEITLAYRFKSKDSYYYSGDEDVAGLISSSKKRRPRPRVSQSQSQEDRRLAEERKAQAALDAEQKAKTAAEAKAEADKKAKLAEEQKAKANDEVKAKLLEEQKAKEEADKQAKLEADQKAKEAKEARAKLAAAQKAKAEADKRAKQIEEQKAKVAAEAQAKLEAEQKAKEAAEVEARLQAEQKAKADAQAQAILLAEQQAQLEAEEKAKLEVELKAQSAKDLIEKPKDELGKMMLALTKSAEASTVAQNELLSKFNKAVDVKDQDLKDLKEENDLSEQGIAVELRPFKSISTENEALQAVKLDLDQIIKTRTEKINRLEELYDDMTESDTLTDAAVLLYYKNTIKRLTSEQTIAVETKTQLESRLETIKVATEYERRRRIKRAAFKNADDRYSLDRATLDRIINDTPTSTTQLTSEDFDFGEERSKNIQIIKNITNVDNGYYLIVAVHNNIENRDAFLRKVVASGEKNIDFFYDVTSSKYFIYSKKVNDIEAANRLLERKGDKPFNTKMSIVKIENE